MVTLLYDFCHFSANGLSNSFDQTVTTELDLPGALFTNTNYTLFMVVSSPTKLNVEGDNISDISNESIDAGTFLQGFRCYAIWSTFSRF